MSTEPVPDLRALAAEKVAGKLEVRRKRNGPRPQRTDDSLPPLVGNIWIPQWSVRPGSYEALRDLTKEVPLWLCIYSRCGPECVPCIQTRGQLGGSIGVTARTVTSYLHTLRDAALVFEVRRGKRTHTRKHRPPARWALDPKVPELWRPKVERAMEGVAEMDGQSTHWMRRALEALDTFERRARMLRNRIEADEPESKRPRRRKSKRRKE